MFTFYARCFPLRHEFENRTQVSCTGTRTQIGRPAHHADDKQHTLTTLSHHSSGILNRPDARNVSLQRWEMGKFDYFVFHSLLSFWWHAGDVRSTVDCRLSICNVIIHNNRNSQERTILEKETQMATLAIMLGRINKCIFYLYFVYISIRACVSIDVLNSH